MTQIFLMVLRSEMNDEGYYALFGRWEIPAYINQEPQQPAQC